MKKLIGNFVVLLVVLGAGLIGSISTALAEDPPPFLLQWGSAGSGDGQFNSPIGMATDLNDNVYVIDQGNHRVQKFTNTGTFLVKWGSQGSFNGQFNYPTGVAIDPAGNIFVADWLNNRIQKFTSTGVFLTKWGSFGSGNGQFKEPFGIACDGAGNIYVTDRKNYRIQKFNGTGMFLAQWGSFGSGNGQFNDPFGVAIDDLGNVFVIDNVNNSVQKFNSTGTFLVKWGSTGNGDGQFSGPYGIAIDHNSNVYVSDFENRRVQKFSGDGIFLTKWNLNFPYGVATDVEGNIYVSNQDQSIHKYGSGTTSHIITSSSGSNGLISPSGAVHVVDGGNQPFQMNPNPGYLIADVVVDGSSVGSPTTYTFTNVTSDHTIYASFAAVHTITVTQPSSNGTISPSTITVVNGSNQTFQITPNEGKFIANVIVDGASVGIKDTYTFTNVTADHSITAVCADHISIDINSFIQGWVWVKPYESQPTSPRNIPNIQVQMYRDDQSTTNPVYANDAGSFTAHCADCFPSDEIRFSTKNDWLEVRHPVGNNTFPEDFKTYVLQYPMDAAVWPSTDSYSGDPLNCYYIANLYGSSFWGLHMNRTPGAYRMITADLTVSGFGGAATSTIAPSVPQSKFYPGKGQYNDAVCHEFVHGMFIQTIGHFLAQQDASHVVDAGSEAKGLDEGLADYFTYAFTLDSDFGNGTGSERSLQNDVRIPWCNISGYRDLSGGYIAAKAVSGSLYELRQSLTLGQAGSPTAEDFDRWVFAAAIGLTALPLNERTPVQFKSVLSSTNLNGNNYASLVETAFNRHNIKSPHDNTEIACGSVPAITSATRTVNQGQQTVQISWTSNSSATSYRVYRDASAGAGLGFGELVGDNLATTSFSYTTDATAQFTLTVVAVDADGTEGIPSDPIEADVVSVGDSKVDSQFLLFAPSPNPSAGRTALQFNLPKDTPVTVSLYDVHGRCLKQWHWYMLNAGQHTITWDGRFDSGQLAPAGVLFARLNASGQTKTTKLVHVR